MAPATQKIQRNMSKLPFRSLAALSNTASTSRVLNLGVIAQRAQSDPEYQQYPLFRSCLNQAIILKHRLRRDEQALFPMGRRHATKIIVPFDRTDLALGGRSIFYGQKDFRQAIKEELGVSAYDLSQDERILCLIDQLPSLDPFLMREHLRRNNLKVASCYFDISAADFKRMQRFVADELKTLIHRASGSDSAAGGQLSKMVSAILSTDVDEKLEPLRAVIGLGPKEFRDGAFSWKGFLYYKWTISELDSTFAKTAASMRNLRLVGPSDHRIRSFVSTTTVVLLRALYQQREVVREALKVYDEAFLALVQGGNARAFREFLLDAPHMFVEIGENISTISHLCSFWQFRFPPGQPPEMTADEAEDFFREYNVGFVDGDQSSKSWEL